MTDWGIIFGLISIIPVIFLVYDRFITSKPDEPILTFVADPESKLKTDRSVVTYSLGIKNTGKTVAQGVEIRLAKAEFGTETITVDGRYTLVKLDYLTSGDSHVFTGIPGIG